VEAGRDMNVILAFAFACIFSIKSYLFDFYSSTVCCPAISSPGQSVLPSKVGYAKLATMCFERSIKAFKYRPKFHLGMHIVEDFALGERGYNPCSASCWGDEDFIGRCSRVSRSCHPLLGATRAIQKMLGMYFQQFSRIKFK